VVLGQQRLPAAGHSLSCWGDNTDGQLGLGDYLARAAPAQVNVAGVSTWSSVTAGYYTTCAIAATGVQAGRLYCWGWDGQLGDNQPANNQNAPVLVDTGTDTWSAVSEGDTTTCAVRSDGTRWCWGDNTYGQAGGPANTPLSYIAPRQVGGSTGWSQVAVGKSVACAVRSSAVWCRGRALLGQLADRAATDQSARSSSPGSPAPGWRPTAGPRPCSPCRESRDPGGGGDRVPSAAWTWTPSSPCTPRSGTGLTG
jgi:alpha-tubulin suppressor-like RCC1 family protein